MNSGNFPDQKKPETQGKNLEEIYRIKEEIERGDRVFETEIRPKYVLLRRLGFEDLKKICLESVGREPPLEEYIDTGGKKSMLPRYREDYIHLLIDELSLEEIRALTDGKISGKRHSE